MIDLKSRAADFSNLSKLSRMLNDTTEFFILSASIPTSFSDITQAELEQIGYVCF